MENPKEENPYYRIEDGKIGYSLPNVGSTKNDPSSFVALSNAPSSLPVFLPLSCLEQNEKNRRQHEGYPNEDEDQIEKEKKEIKQEKKKRMEEFCSTCCTRCLIFCMASFLIGFIVFILVCSLR